MADRPEQLLSAGVSRHSREVFWTRIWSKLLPCLFAVLASETDEEKHDSFELFADREVGITNTGNTEKFFRFLIASFCVQQKFSVCISGQLFARCVTYGQTETEQLTGWLILYTDD